MTVVVSEVKSQDYSSREQEEIRGFPDTAFNGPASTAKWEFELFSPRAVFPPSNLHKLLQLRAAIANVQNVKVQHFLLLVLLSILPQVGLFIKDGGVLKIDRRKRAMPVKAAFRRKVKHMLQDLQHPITGPVPHVQLADARQLPWEDDVADIIVTSPPYLNNVDYSKVYGLELSLLFLDKNITKQMRSQSVRSFITSNQSPEAVPQEIGEIGYKIPVIGNYFSDMERTLHEVHRILKPGKACYFIVGNSVIYGTEIYVDELLAGIATRLGLQANIIVGSERWADVKPRKVKIRESVLVLRK